MQEHGNHDQHERSAKPSLLLHLFYEPKPKQDLLPLPPLHFVHTLVQIQIQHLHTSYIDSEDFEYFTITTDIVFIHPLLQLRQQPGQPVSQHFYLPHNNTAGSDPSTHNRLSRSRNCYDSDLTSLVTAAF